MIIPPKITRVSSWQKGEHVILGDRPTFILHVLLRKVASYRGLQIKVCPMYACTPKVYVPPEPIVKGNWLNRNW